MQPTTGETAVNVPAFLSKLWNMVNEPWTDHLICWSPGGKSVIIQNQMQFWYELLPQYYKHNNMSSFVRQLNMYGFHKISSVENGSTDVDKDEFQFYHPYFQKGQPELLKNIKRKVTGSRGSANNENVIQTSIKQDDLTKVLSDVKYLKGRQANVDSQLTAMKQENAVLWRELAVMRQKHIKQQQIVNKLIQFLVTIVQPATRMGGLGVKRLYPLMINESPQPTKKSKGTSSTTSDGPTIHELDGSNVLPDELFVDNDEIAGDKAYVRSPSVSSQELSPLNELDNVSIIDSVPSNILETNPENLEAAIVDDASKTVAARNFPTSDDLLNANLMNSDQIQNDAILNAAELVDDTINLVDGGEFVNVEEFVNDGVVVPDKNDLLVEELLNSNAMNVEGDSTLEEALPLNQTKKIDEQEVFLNSSAPNALLSKLNAAQLPAGYVNPRDENNVKGLKKEADENQKNGKNLAVATRDPTLGFTKLTSVEDFDVHLENTQSELDQLKELLNGCGNLDANALLGLFSDDALNYDLPENQEEDTQKEDLISGSEVAAYGGSGLMDFNQLLEPIQVFEDFENQQNSQDVQDKELNTPQITAYAEPKYPIVKKTRPKKR